jgi:cell wall assembly regulator SMI1
MKLFYDVLNKLGSKIDRPWSPANDAEINRFENLIGHKLPDDYHEFLKSVNGGELDPILSYRFLETGRETESTLQLFYGLHDVDTSNLTRLFNVYHVYQKRMPEHLIPIASDEGGNKICLNLSPDKFGEIVFFDHENEVDFEDSEDLLNPYRNCHRIAGSFSEFLSLLES